MRRLSGKDSLRISGSRSSVAATERMSSASAASPRHNAMSAVRAGWSRPAATFRSMAGARCDDAPTVAAMKR